MGGIGDVAKTAFPVAGFANSGVTGGKGGDAPKAPDFNAAATPNQTNAFGVNSNWTKGPNGQYTQNQSFGGPLGQAGGEMGSQAASAWGTPLNNGQQARDAAQNAIYSRETSNLDPQWGQQESQFNSQMAAQGLQPGSQAYDAAKGNFDRAKTNAYQQASYGSIIGGGQEGQRQQQMDINSRMAPLQGLEGMAGLTGQSQNPLLAASMAQYQGDLQKYGIQQQGKNSSMAGMSNLGGAALMSGM